MRFLKTYLLPGTMLCLFAASCFAVSSVPSISATTNLQTSHSNFSADPQSDPFPICPPCVPVASPSMS